MASAQIFHDHVKELRRRILWVFLSVTLSAGLAYVLRVRIVQALQHPLGAPLFYSSPAGSFNFVLQLSMLIGVFIALPVVVYHLVRFIEPALPVRISRKVLTGIIAASFGMALAGVAFSFFYLLPMSLKFFSTYSSDQIKPLISASEYLSFVTGHLITFALMFQIPLIVMFINWIKPIKPGKLLRYQRHVVVGAFGLAVVLPFTYDPISQFIVAIPIVVLYYLSIILLWVANRGHKNPKPILEPTVQSVEQSQPRQPLPEPHPLVPTPVVPVAMFNRRQTFTTDGFVSTRNMQRIRPSAVQPVKSIERPIIYRTHSSRPSLPSLRRPQLSVDGFM